METQEKTPSRDSFKGRAVEANRSGRAIAGIIVVIVGAIFLARQLGVDFPYWVFKWEMILIAIGLFLGFRHSFKGPAWLILIIIGSVFLIDDIFPYTDVSRYVWPVLIIGIGLYMIFRGRSSGGRDQMVKTWEAEHGASLNSSDDFIDSTAIFGGVKKQIISKTFRGGEAVTFFGGTEINLTQADVNHRIVLDLTNVFGGTKLVVPPHWKIQSEDLVCIFGGIEDKRPMLSDTSTVDPNKVLILKGTCIFGGIDIKSF
jgi:predicted membrane protein